MKFGSPVKTSISAEGLMRVEAAVVAAGEAALDEMCAREFFRELTSGKAFPPI
jgi:hypothetical protein